MALPSPRGTLLTPLAYPWLKGPATRVGNSIVLDGETVERYEPMGVVSTIGIALLRVRTPDDAVAFASAFGLLQPHWVDKQTGEPFSPPRHRHLDRWPSARIETPFADFEVAAQGLRNLARELVDVSKAAGGDAAALDRVRRQHGPLLPDQIVTIQTVTGERRLKASEWLSLPHLEPGHRDLVADLPRRMAPMTDREVLTEASAWAAMGISEGLMDARAYVFEPAQLFPDDGHEPGTIRIGVLPDTLLGFCYLSLAQHFSRRDQKPALCLECDRVFIPTHGKQEYCEPACANRARWARWKRTPAYRKRSAEKNARKVKAHGKATR